MKFSLAAVSVIACTLQAASGSSLRNGRSLLVSEAGCPGGADSPQLVVSTNECTLEKFKAKIAGKIDASTCTLAPDDILAAALGTTTATLEADLRAACLDAYANHDTVDFGFITQKDDRFHEEYFAGGTKWNYEVQTNAGDNVLKYDALRVDLVRDNEARHGIITIPQHVRSFDPDQDGCDINAAYCCWVKDRQANDNNGNCATPYDSDCIDKDPADNANLCYVDHERSPEVSHVAGGFTIFGDVAKNREAIEGPIHCHGFAWANEKGDHVLDPSRQYRGNNLFFVSMFDHMYTRGYVKNVPGSPMCGCAENMAVVTRADCTEIAATETFKLTYDRAAHEGDPAAVASIDVTTKEIKFNACQGINGNNNDLEAYYEQLVKEDKASTDDLAVLRKSLVGDTAGQCTQAILEFLKTKDITLSQG